MRCSKWVLGLTCTLVIAPAFAAVPAEVITYQGQLKQDGVPLSGFVDLKVTLWDDAVANAANPPVKDRLNVEVVNGLFTVELDFPASSFSQAHWLGIQVRSPAGSANAYETLSPRQAIRAAPYALYALNGGGGGSGGTLDQAYDFGGPGAGRTITADSGAVSIAGAGGLNVSGGISSGPVKLNLDSNDFDIQASRGPILSQDDPSNVTLGGLYFTGTVGSPVPHWACLNVATTAHRIRRDSGSDFRFAVETAPNSQFFTDQMTLTDTGRLGIGTSTPVSMLQINDNTDLTPGSGGVLVLGATSSANLAFDGNEIMSRNAGATAPLTINLEGGSVGIGTNPSSSFRLHVNVPNTDSDSALYSVTYGSGRAAVFESHQGNTNPAVTIMKNGGPALRVSGSLTATDAATDAPLSVIGGSDSEPSGGGYAVFGSVTGANLSIDNNEIMARNGGTTAALSLNADGGNVIVSQNGSGNLGVGTSSPKGKIHVNGDYYGRGHLYLYAYEGDGASGTAFVQARDDSTTSNIDLQLRSKSGSAAVDVLTCKSNGRVGIGTTAPAQLLHVNGTARVNVLQITGGADLSENFEVTGDRIEPGMVVAIDPHNPGRLQLSTGAYDRTVAGIISGAGGVKTGMTMSQEGTVADGGHAVALTGRVYCWVDATTMGVQPGDLLTTAELPGHAMKVTDHNRAAGAIIGKAMSSLPQGERGLVLVLVSLQ